MDETKYRPGAALCPECGSVVEYLHAKCPWCSHAFTGHEALKIFSMLSETGVEPLDLHGELMEAGEPVGSSMLPFAKDNFEKGSQGSKMASLLVYQEYGDLSELPVSMMEEGFKKSSNQVKIEIIKSLTKAGTQEAVGALKRLKDYENDPEVLQSFTQKVSVDSGRRAISEEISMEMLSVQDIELADAGRKPGPSVPPVPPALPTSTGQRKGPPPLPQHSPSAAVPPIPTAEEILPPMPEVPPPRKPEHKPAAVKEKPAAKSSSQALGLILMGVGFVVTGIIVLVVLVALGVKIPLEDKFISKGGDKKQHAAPDKQGQKKVKEAPPDAVTKPIAVVDAAAQQEEPRAVDAPAAMVKLQPQLQPQPKPQPKPVPAAVESVKLAFAIAVSSLNSDYPATNMIDGDPATVWQQKKKDKPLKQSITLIFGKEVTVTAMAFITGYDDRKGKRGDMFPLNNRLKKVSVKFSDGTTRELSFEDKRNKQAMMIAPPVRTKVIVLTILEVYKGSWFNDLAIAEIEAEGY